MSPSRADSEALRALRADYQTIQQLVRELPVWSPMNHAQQVRQLTEIRQVLERSSTIAALLAIQDGTPIAGIARLQGVSRQAAHRRYQKTLRSASESDLSD